VAAPILGPTEVLAARAFDGVAQQAVPLDDVGHDALGGDRGPSMSFAVLLNIREIRLI
jgi:hypothetical protein